MAGLTTTSYSLLCLLATRPWSAYELTAQAKSSLRFAWPRAETRIYQEPKNLVAHGLARVRTETNGRRNRTVYTITPKGRRALADWLEQPSSPPVFASESILRIAFAEHGSHDALLRTLRELQTHGRTMHHDVVDILRGYAEHGEPFPDRLHLNVLVGQFLFEYTALLERWATWATSEVAQWSSTGPADAVPIAWEALRRALETAPAQAPETSMP